MSYSICLVPPKEICDTCQRRFPEIDGPDPTYNLSPIFDRALSGVAKEDRAEDAPWGLRILSGRVAEGTVVQLNDALGRIREDRKTFLALEPDNGWGDLGGAVQTLERLVDLAIRWPDHVWKIT